jgi:hypothetical protein
MFLRSILLNPIISKKIFIMRSIFILLAVLSSYLGLHAQPITLTRADFPKPTASSSLPDSVLYTNILGVTSTVYNQNGASQNWDAADQVGTTVYQNFQPMSATPLAFQITFFGSDYATPLLSGAGLLGTGGTATDAYEYYNYASSDSRLEIKGFGANISFQGSTPVPLPALYTSPDVLYRFPITFGNSDSSNSGYDLSVPLGGLGTVGLKRQQKRVNNVDAWGTLITPAGTFNVLRVTSNIDRLDSVVSGLGSFGFPSTVIEYKWLGQGLKVPALQINGNVLGGNFVATTGTYWGAGAVGSSMPLFQSQVPLVLYPNPTATLTHASYSLNEPATVGVNIVSMTGNVVAEFHFAHKSAGHFSQALPVQHLANGLYQVVCTVGTETLREALVISQH